METHADKQAMTSGERRVGEQWLRLVSEAIPQLVWSCSAEGDCEYVNERFIEYTGVAYEQALESGWFQCVHPDDREQILSAWLTALEQRTVYDAEYRLCAADGSYRWFKAHAVPLVNREGAFLRWLGTSTDIHGQRTAREALEEAIRTRDSEIAHRKLLEEQVRRSESRMRAVLNQAIDSYIAMDSDGLIVEWNKEAERCFGWARQEVIGLSMSKTIVPERFRPAHENGLRALLADRQGRLFNQKIEMTALRRDGHEFPVEMKLLVIDEGETQLFAAFIADISDRKHAEAVAATRTTQALEAESRLQAVLASMRDGLCQLDTEGCCVYLNPAGEKIFGYKLQELRGKVMHDFVHAPNPDGKISPASDCEVRQAARDPRPHQTAEGTVLTKDKTIVPIQFSVAPLMLGEKHMGAVVVFRDISEQIKMREERESFLALLAHDMKTPLIAADQVLGAILQKQSGELNTQQIEVLSLVKQSNAELLAIVQEVLEIYRYSSENLLQKEDLHLEDLIADCIKTLSPAASEKAIKIEFPRTAEQCRLYADRTAMRHLFMNLLWNAIKFTRAGEGVSIEAERDVVTNSITVHVRDSGEGIPLEEQKKLFQPFWQGASGKRRPGGSGLGLYLCRQIVESHHGKIECVSTEGGGTTFTLILPLYG
jgi:PAS domain S-box-containing protein